MVAEVKSHVLRRDEKGFMGVPFKRLLFAGVGGGLVLTLSRLALGNWAFVVAGMCFISLLLLTGPRGGIPLWQRLLYRWRGGLMLAAARNPNSLAGRLGTFLEVPADLVSLEAEHIFTPPEVEVEADLTEWVTFVDAGEVDYDEGLVFVEQPAQLSLDEHHG